jgi:hypothetical protein
VSSVVQARLGNRYDTPASDTTTSSQMSTLDAQIELAQLDKNELVKVVNRLTNSLIQRGKTFLSILQGGSENRRATS